MEHSATYCPEDNKLRLYPASRLDTETYQRVKAAGFKWAPKQEIFVAPSWSPDREDLLLDLCEYIGDEDYSPEERAADRAERFAGYQDKRFGEANSLADTFESGPQAFGHQSAARAQRQANRHDRTRRNAVNQWSKAEYWQTRTAGVIGHALHKSSPEVRRGRLLRLESELRRFARSERWKSHYELRIGYEKAMLENEGGMLAEVVMEPGGWIGKHQIHAVNKSPVTGRVVSVKLMAPKRWWRDAGPAPLTLQSFNVERMGSEAYRAPTDEERAQFATATKDRKAKEKASKPKAPPLINPTEADALRLQTIWNEQAKRSSSRCETKSEICRMTQAQYSERSKGSYATFETIEITEKLNRFDRRGSGRVVIFKIRKASGKGSDFYAADRVIVITDKPQKQIPWDEVAAIAESMPTIESVTETLPRLYEMQHNANLRTTHADEFDTLLENARYVGYGYRESTTQFGLTDAGMATLKQMQLQSA